MDNRVLNGYGLAVKRRREELGLKQYEVADRAEVSRVYMSKVEIGQVRIPSEERQERIAAVLEVDPDVLLAEARRYEQMGRAVQRGRPAWDADRAPDQIEGRLMRLLLRLDHGQRLGVLAMVELLLGVEPGEDA